MKFTSLLVGLVLLFILVLLPSVSFGQEGQDLEIPVEKIDVYAFFWPIVPGKTVNDSMFWLKQLKEQFGDFFSFGDINKSGSQITLSEKRFVEANKLLEDKDYDNAKKTLDMNKQNRDSALKFMKKAQEEKRQVDELKSRLVVSLQNQEMVLKYLLTQLPDDQKPKIEEVLKDLTLQISEAR